MIVHLLGAEQIELAKLGATSGIDRFADRTIWDRLITGEPYFPSAHAWIRGRVINRMEAGTSTVIAVHALQAKLPEDAGDAAPLVYHNRAYHALGEHSRDLKMLMPAAPRADAGTQEVTVKVVPRARGRVGADPHVEHGRVEHEVARGRVPVAPLVRPDSERHPPLLPRRRGRRARSPSARGRVAQRCRCAGAGTAARPRRRRGPTRS